jgi:hypothetical protein
MQALVDPSTGIDRALDGDFVRRALVGEATDTDVKIFVVFTNHNHVDLFRCGVFKRRVHAGIELDWSEVDGLAERKSKVEQKAPFEHSRRHQWGSHSTQEDGVALFQAFFIFCWKHFARAQIAFATEVEVFPFDLKALKLGHEFESLDTLLNHLRADSITSDYANLEHRTTLQNLQG